LGGREAFPIAHRVNLLTYSSGVPGQGIEKSLGNCESRTGCRSSCAALRLGSSAAAFVSGSDFLPHSASTNGGVADFGEAVATLNHLAVKWCPIGGLAVNCYVSPVYAVDAEFVVVSEALDTVAKRVKDQVDLLRIAEQYPETSPLMPPS